MSASDRDPARIQGDKLDGLVQVLQLIRSGAARTRGEVGDRAGLGRTAVIQRITPLLESGLIREGLLGASTGGRSPRQLEFCADNGYILAAELGATSINVGVADLNGKILESFEVEIDVLIDPETVMRRVEGMLDSLVLRLGIQSQQIWGIGLGIPAPVEYATGKPMSPPIMPSWDGYNLRSRLEDKFSAPAWIDNEVNLMALGELRGGLGRGHQDFLYVKVGTGIGAGIIIGGRLHRGAQGSAGDIGHIAAVTERVVICRCGNINCLEALAGGAAIARDAREISNDESVFQGVTLGSAVISARDVAEAAANGDSRMRRLLSEAGMLIGLTLAQLVNFFNPSLVIIGGGVTEAGDFFLAAIRQATYARSTPLATRDLRITRQRLSKQSGLVGAAAVVIDELLRADQLSVWIDEKSPHGFVHAADGQLH